MAARQATRMYRFITNNHTLFHLWWDESLLNHQKVSKYDKRDCLQKIILLLMSLLTALIVKNSHILAGLYFIFLKNVLYQTWLLIPNLEVSEKIQKRVIK